MLLEGQLLAGCWLGTRWHLRVLTSRGPALSKSLQDAPSSSLSCWVSAGIQAAEVSCQRHAARLGEAAAPLPAAAAAAPAWGTLLAVSLLRLAHGDGDGAFARLPAEQSLSFGAEQAAATLRGGFASSSPSSLCFPCMVSMFLSPKLSLEEAAEPVLLFCCLSRGGKDCCQGLPAERSLRSSMLGLPALHC